MAASFSTFVGLPKAAAKSNPTQPAPMLTGSETTRPSRTGAGIPIETTSYVQSAARSRIRGTIASGVRDGPEAKRRSGAPSAEVRAFTCEPPTSMPRIVLISVSIQRNEVDAPLFRLYPAGDSPRGGILKRNIFAAVAAAAAILAVVGSALAITNGQPDGNRHPEVG